MSIPIIPGAEAISLTNGDRGGVLLLHGYMGTVQTIRDWAMAFAQAGFSVEAPLLPGHGTSVEDMLDTQWSDYMRCAEQAYSKLLERHQNIIVGGICTGSMLAASVVVEHPETTVGLISVNGFFKLPKHWNFGFMEEMAETNRRFFAWFRGKSIEDPDAPALITYEQAAIAPILSMRPANYEIWPHLKEIRCPVLAFSSLLDKVVPAKDPNTNAWIAELTAPVERVLLERSNHVATLDYDKGIIEARSVAWANAVVEGLHDHVSKEVA